MITEIATDSANEAAVLADRLLQALTDAEMELEDTLEQYDTLMYGDTPPDPEQEDKGQVIADLLWDARDLRNEVDNLLLRVQDFADVIEKELR